MSVNQVFFSLTACIDASFRAYLVRDSTTVSNSYVLTMYAKSVAKNFQILPVSDYTYIHHIIILNGMCLFRLIIQVVW